MRQALPYRILTLAALGAAMTACDSANLIGPSNQLEVTNAVDQFQLQLTDLVDVDDSRSYEWENTGAQATVDISQAISSGAAFLTITDSNGDIVYQDDLANDNDATTTAGVAGTWRIDVRLESATGTFNFRVQKVT